MWPKPDDKNVVRRMRAAHWQARRALHARSAPGPQVWGWHGRTLGQPVITTHGPAWLRLHSSHIDQIIATFWDGNIDAQCCLLASIPRPRLLHWHDWIDPPWAYRAELYEHVAARPLARQAILNTYLDLPNRWWAALRDAVDAIAAVPTHRVCLHPGFLAWAMPHYLAASADSDTPIRWTTAHGDFHYTNLCGPDLHILDWEGWGTAPAGYDAATLHSYSLLVPAAAARVRDEFTDLLDTPTGRYAELAVITELLHTITYGNNLELAEPLRRRAGHLLGRAVPAVQHRPAGY